MKVSVIVPVYNVESYLKKCLDSLINQDFNDYEIVIINDGSKDNSEQIALEYKEKYPKKIKYFKKENGGLSSARNLGIEKSRGHFLAFVDSDDYVDQSFLKKLYTKITEDDFDMVVCDIILDYNGSFKYKDSSFNTDIIASDLIKDKMADFYPIVCNKLYKKELFTKDNYFKEGIWFEDVEFMYRLFSKIKKIGVVKDGLYYYFQNPKSITSTFNYKLYNHIDNWDGIFKYYQDKHLLSKYQDVLEYSYTRYAYATFLKRACNFDYQEYQKALNYALNKVKKNTHKRFKNKYFYHSFKGLYLLFFNKLLGKLMYFYFHKKRSDSI